MTSPQRSASTRVGEDDRENAVRRVREAYAEQRITHEEMDDRLDRVLAATTYGDLAVALGALPAEDPGATSTHPHLGGDGVRAAEDPPRLALRSPARPVCPVRPGEAPACSRVTIRSGASPRRAVKGRVLWPQTPSVGWSADPIS